MSSRPWYRIWPEYVALLFGLGWVPLLPRRAIVGLSRFFSAVAFRHATKLRQVGLANLNFIYGDSKSDDEKRALLRNTFQSFALLVLDIIWFTFRPHQRCDKWVTWDESCDPVFEDGATLILTAHYGNWETVGLAYASKGQPIMSVAAALKNPPVNDLFIKLRQQTGQTIIPQKGAARPLLNGLKSGKKLAVLLDQNTRPSDGGQFVEFFGLPVPVSTVPAALALKTNARILTVTMAADQRGLYTVTVHEEIKPDPDAENPVLALTQKMSHSVERVVRENPTPWCWMYKRWRFVPEDHDLEDYPDYAKRL